VNSPLGSAAGSGPGAPLYQQAPVHRQMPSREFTRGFRQAPSREFTREFRQAPSREFTREFRRWKRELALAI
jgi:hypothetical protein